MSAANPGIDHIMTAKAVRAGSRRVAELVEAGDGLLLFHPENLSHCIDLVVESCRQNYPDLSIPLHSRWRHFDIGNEYEDCYVQLFNFRGI